MSFIQRMDALLSPLKVDALWVAYSGGLDSCVLLQRLVGHLPPHYTLRAVHIHHGLNSQADAWAAHCQQTCAALGIECRVIKVNVDVSPGQSIEASARQARYRAFSELLTSKAALLTAHHGDDQAETLLLQLLRGAGPKGLASMPEVSSLGAGYLVRPLLNESRQQLAKEAAALHLSWIDDDSNQNERFDRNFLRHRIMPLLQQRWPAAARTLSRSARLCAETTELLETFTRQDYQKTMGSKPSILKRNILIQYPVPRQKQVLRFWFAQLDLPAPDEIHLKQMLRDVVNSQRDAAPIFSWKGAQIRRFGDEIHGILSHPLSPLKSLTWSMNEPLILPHSGALLRVEPQREKGLKRPEKHQTVTVRFREGGERFQPAGRQGSHPLKKLFQEWKVPPWERSQIPLIYYDEALVMVVGYALEDSYQVAPGEEGITVIKSISSDKERAL